MNVLFQKYFKNKEGIYYWTLLAGSLAVFVSYMAPYIFTERLWSDEALYIWYAKQISLDPSFLFSKEIVSRHPPLFSFILSLGYSLFPSIYSCQLLVFIFSVLCLLAIYILGTLVSGPFAGLLSLILLGQSYLFVVFATKVLIDIPLMLFFMIFFIFVLIPRKRLRQKDLLLGIIGALIILLKWSGLLLIPILLCVYFFRLESDDPDQSRRERVFTSLAVIGIVLIVLMVNQLVHWGSISPYQKQVNRISFENMLKYISYAKMFFNSFFLWPLFFVGIYHAVRNRHKAGFLIFIWLVLSFFALSFVPNAEVRYALNLVAPVILLTAMGMETLLKKIFVAPRKLFLSRLIVLIYAFYVGLYAFPGFWDKLEEHNKAYVGFKEAGTWVKSRLRPDSLIMASSYRQIRYYADINFSSPQTVCEYREPKQLKEILKHPGPIILEIDNWRFFVIDPLDKNYFAYLKAKGFILKKTFGPKIWIFERE